MRSRAEEPDALGEIVQNKVIVQGSLSSSARDTLWSITIDKTIDRYVTLSLFLVDLNLNTI